MGDAEGCVVENGGIRVTYLFSFQEIFLNTVFQSFLDMSLLFFHMLLQVSQPTTLLCLPYFPL